MTDNEREAMRQALDALASARSVIDSDRAALLDCHTDADGDLDDDAKFAAEEYAGVISWIDAAADRLARVMREASDE